MPTRQKYAFILAFAGIMLVIILLPSNMMAKFTLYGVDEAKNNPIGLMLGAPGLSLEKRISLVKELGASYFRPNAVIVETWNGNSRECEAARKAGLKIILTARNNGGGQYNPTSPPKDIKSYKWNLGKMLDECRPVILVVENEENSEIFYKGTPEQYGAELKAACEVAHGRGIKCTNGGLVSSLVALLVYNHYLDIGDTAKARSFAERAFEPAMRGRLNSPAAREQLEKGKELLKAYKLAGIDYLNFHWYIGDTKSLGEVVQYLRNQTGLPVITNEIGQTDLNPETTAQLLGKMLEFKIPCAVWYSIDAGKAKALINNDGTLRITGEAFKTFMRKHF